jgi:hypothetical protein
MLFFRRISFSVAAWSAGEAGIPFIGWAGTPPAKISV